MNDFTTLDSALRRNSLLAAATCLALLAIAIASLAFAITTAGNARAAGLRMPVLVVPGAIGGVYTPGITEENVRATARYLAGLATNFSGEKSFRERFDELEIFSSAQFLPALQHARTELQRDVDTQNQSRTFFPAPGSEILRQLEDGRFDYCVTGERVVYASGLPMQSRGSQVHLRLRWGSPSQRNRAGIVLEGFDVKDLPATVASNAPPAN
jgi:hypothetical protein